MNSNDDKWRVASVLEEIGVALDTHDESKAQKW